MWNSVPFLSALAFWSLLITAVSGGVAVVSGLIGGLAAGRASDIVTRNANVDIANANARLEQAKLETEKLKKEFSWREIGQSQNDEIKNIISGKSFPVTISWTAGDSEGSHFARQLGNALTDAGVSVVAFSPMALLGEEAHGLSVGSWNKTEIDTLSAAFIAAGFGKPKVKIYEKPAVGQPGSITHIFVGYRSVPVVGN
ncbi:hypothetical protein PMI04_007985 [Sphingobium sp. AP49]|uniref:hypothetical protein n=1 Tax=Sphingobium sp. AP49 TaxID=1144307 RepID=UPI00026ECF87|nr:hypothetical protein [Sphingobium sp. AP49]WHO40525.1 hypothetical protein PMI04_007985 [Sphingobium sp. AP49]